MIGVQMEGCAPIVRAFLGGERFADPWEDAVTDAAGLRVPGSVGDFLILEAIVSSGGTAIAVPESALAETQAFAARHGAGFLSLESAAAFARNAGPAQSGSDRCRRHRRRLRHGRGIQVDAPGTAGADTGWRE